MKFLCLAFFSFAFTQVTELGKLSLLNDKIELLVPKEFRQMTQQMLDIKYPHTQNRPTFVLTNGDATINIAFNHLPNPADESVIESYKDNIKSSYQKSFPSAGWKGDGVMTVNGKKAGYLKLITDAKDQKVYNYIFLTDIDGKLLIGTFNCIEKLLPEWEAVSEQIVKSLKAK